MLPAPGAEKWFGIPLESLAPSHREQLGEISTSSACSGHWGTEELVAGQGTSTRAAQCPYSAPPAGPEGITLCRETRSRGGPGGGHALCSPCPSGALALAWAASLLLSHPGCNATSCQEALLGQVLNQPVLGQTKLS